MLHCGADVNEIEPNYGSGLWNAIWDKASIEKIRFLVEHGADINHFKPSRITYSLYAAFIAISNAGLL